MIKTPDRIKGFIELVESGASAEELQARLKQIAILQPFDILLVQRQFVEEAIQLQEQEDARIEALINGAE